MISKSVIQKIGLFAGGVLFGTAGVKALSSKDAKKAYVHMTAAGLRVKECVLDTVNTVQENAEDILAEAKAVNESREKEEVISDKEGEEEMTAEATKTVSEEA